MRLTARSLAVLGAILGLLVVWSTDQILPASSAYQAQMRIWLVARASGLTAYVVLTFIVAIGLVLSHPINKSTWKLSKRLFPWHENLLTFVVAFTAAHVASLVADPYAGVGLVGAFVPGASTFRSVPVAIGTFAMYGLLVTGLTARYTKLLPAGMWLKIHRLSILVWGATWAHGILAGTDSVSAAGFYVATGLVMLAAATYRYWVGKQARPTFATSLHDPATEAHGAGHEGDPSDPRPAPSGASIAASNPVQPKASSSEPTGPPVETAPMGTVIQPTTRPVSAAFTSRPAIRATSTETDGGGR